jgi:hypothetical protein
MLRAVLAIGVVVAVGVCSPLAEAALITPDAPPASSVSSPVAPPVPPLATAAPTPPPAAATRASPKRPVPDYDGRGPPRPKPGDAFLWVPRVLLSPAYLAVEYLVREPLSVAVPAAEHADLPRKVYDFFTFGPDHKAGFFPVAFVEFDFNPSVGVYAFWDDAGFAGDSLHLHVEAWPPDWVGGSLTQRVRMDPRQTLELRVSGIRRPDRVFYGLGPTSSQEDQSRYGQQRFELAATFERRFRRSSRVLVAVGFRDVTTYDGHYGSDPSLLERAASGAFAVPPGFGQEYSEEYNRAAVTLDTRTPAGRPGSGARLELAAEQGNNVRPTPASGWLRYGATAAGYIDLNGRARTLGLSLTTILADPLGSAPIPFTELVYLGGDHPMPAYFTGRLIDRSAAVATASYAWPVAPWLDGRLEVATGNVFGAHLTGFEPRLLRLSAALGLSVAGAPDLPFEFLVGVGTEPFSLGGRVDSVRAMLGVPRTF